MKNIFFVMLTMSLLTTGCYFPISGRVVDAETQKPIEGAVVLVEWTKTHGIGLTYTKSYKVAEAVSDKEGKFDLPGCYSPFVDDPNVTIYKKGYVAWSSRWVFPRHKNRNDYKWGNQNIRLEHFLSKYSYIEHTGFIRSSMNSAMNFEAKKGLYNAFSWEDQLASQERDRNLRTQ